MLRETLEGLGESGGLFIGRHGWQVYTNAPGLLSLASRDHISDRRESIRPPIRTKPRPTCSVRRAGHFYLTLIPFSEHFSAPNKIIRLLSKRGFRFDGDGWSCGGSCDGARVKPGVAKRSCAI